MTAIRLDMTMSLDGFIAGPDDRPGQEMGLGGFRLFNWLDDRDGPGPNGEVYAESMATGAIISGRRTFELAGRWNGDHHDGVPDPRSDPPRRRRRRATRIRTLLHRRGRVRRRGPGGRRR